MEDIRAARVENNIIVDVWMVPSLTCFDGINLILVPDEVGIGWTVTSTGEFIAPILPPAAAPLSVSRFQAMAVLLQTGYLSDVEAIMVDPLIDSFVVIAWKNAQEFRRDSVLVLEIAAKLNITTTQLEDLFRFASTIKA